MVLLQRGVGLILMMMLLGCRACVHFWVIVWYIGVWEQLFADVFCERACAANWEWCEVADARVDQIGRQLLGWTQFSQNDVV